MVLTQPQFAMERSGCVLSAILWTMYLPTRYMVRLRYQTPYWLVWADAVTMGLNFFWWRWIPVPTPLLSVIVVWEAVWSLPMGQALAVSGLLSGQLALVTIGSHPTLPDLWTMIFVIPFYPLITVLVFFLRQQFTSVHDMAHHDALTGLTNRLQLGEVYNQQRGQPLWAILLDLDDFKAINDHYGHIVGDHVLQTVGALMQLYFRRDCVASRYGGEEFVLLVPATLPPAALKGRLTQFVEQLDDEAATLPSPVTLSGGVVRSHGNESLDALISRADTLLYKAKTHGKNLILWDPEISLAAFGADSAPWP